MPPKEGEVPDERWLLIYTQTMREAGLEGAWVVDEQGRSLGEMFQQTNGYVQLTREQSDRLRNGPPVSIQHGHLVSPIPSNLDLVQALLPGAGTRFAITGPNDEIMRFSKVRSLSEREAKDIVEFANTTAREIMDLLFSQASVSMISRCN